MKQQQAINKYVDLIKRYEKRKKSYKSNEMSSQQQKLLALTNTLFFKKTEQQKVKQKIKEIKQETILLKPTLKTLNIEANSDMIRTKRKFQAYQEEVQKKHIIQRQKQLQSFHPEKWNQPQAFRETKRIFMQETYKFMPFQSQNNSYIIRKNEHPLQKDPQKIEHIQMNRRMCQLDGYIFYFENPTAKPAVLFKNILHNKQIPNTKQKIYQLLKTTSPFTIKSKLLGQTLIDNRSFAFRMKQELRPIVQDKQSIQKGSRATVRQTGCKSKMLCSMHRRERSSLINLRAKVQYISGWQYTDDH